MLVLDGYDLNVDEYEYLRSEYVRIAVASHLVEAAQSTVETMKEAMNAIYSEFKSKQQAKK